MKSLLIFTFLIMQTLQASASSNIKVDCYSDARLRYSPPEASAVLCSNVSNKDEIEAVINCYFDDDLRSAASPTSALLCSSVRSKAEARKVISCYFNSGATDSTLWSSILTCK